MEMNYGNSIFATVQLSTADNRLKEQHPVAKIVLCEPSCAVPARLVSLDNVIILLWKYFILWPVFDFKSCRCIRLI